MHQVDLICAGRPAILDFVGFDDGRLAELADTVVHVSREHDVYGPVEGLHVLFARPVANHVALRRTGDLT